ncbi:YfhE-like protein [Aneurinibacillus soli]|uniref:Uncharacterized protein n=1 Tax=Aneurinibacillus soli TaxID=1500254 RepID=A0A0U4NIP4_9BACL|nr:YfhE family protein [Aneurinibacillus soli]PYE62184.1 YfhE-like protein [Aneurinibacillus soli]BAU28628.1 hypothetical protein CB4_02803 [Aneurinibacillus soli]
MSSRQSRPIERPHKLSKTQEVLYNHEFKMADQVGGYRNQTRSRSQNTNTSEKHS